MNDMNRENFDELRESYALNALPEDERREFERYLALHPERQAEVEELSTLAGLMALSTPEHEPTAELRRSLMSVVEGEARESRAASRREAHRSTLTRARDYLGIRRLVFGVAALALVGLLSWNVFEQSRIQDLQSNLEQAQSRTVELQGSQSTQEASVKLVKLQDGSAVLVAENLPPLGKDKTYQAWVFHGNKPVPSTLISSDEKVTAAPVTEFKGADMVAITVEPAGGSEAPTSNPMMSAKL